jgi:hypothetical protein
MKGKVLLYTQFLVMAVKKIDCFKVKAEVCPGIFYREIL